MTRSVCLYALFCFPLRRFLSPWNGMGWDGMDLPQSFTNTKVFGTTVVEYEFESFCYENDFLSQVFLVTVLVSGKLAQKREREIRGVDPLDLT